MSATAIVLSAPTGMPARAYTKRNPITLMATITDAARRMSGLNIAKRAVAMIARKSAPRWANDTSPGRGCRPPPIIPFTVMEW